jgi:threonine dehydratase
MTTVESIAARSVQSRRRIQDHIYETPLIPSKHLGQETGTRLYFKAENFQLTGSFKARGAASKMTALSVGRDLITASSGNHGIACAHAASRLGQELTVVLPETVSKAKLARIETYGVEIILHGVEPKLAELHAQALAARGGLIYISPYNDEDVIAGQGTIGLELLEQAERIDNIFIAMGGGGLISGVGAVLKNARPKTKVFGISAKNSAALAASMEAGRVVETEHFETLADGIAGGVDNDSLTLPLATSVVEDVIACSEDEIADALRLMALQEHQLVEGAAALALAGFLKAADRLQDQVSVVLLCGSNYDTAKILPIITG